MQAALTELDEQARKALLEALDGGTVEDWKKQFLNKKKGVLAPFFADIRNVPAEERGAYGQQLNALLESWTALVGETGEVGGNQFSWPLDPATLPTADARGSRHPLSLTRERILDILAALGFTIDHGPHIETEFHNFGALNLPEHHPARDMQDTFYADLPATELGRWPLRTHTSPVQVRHMQTHKPPIRMVAPGRVFRADSDATHSPMFQQIEGLWIEDGVTFAHLKGLLQYVMSALFESDLSVRLRPSYFPFTEPSAEVDLQCFACLGKGCRTCSQSGWIEVLGCGMIHPNVLEASGLDPTLAGLAFGLGVERLAMLRYGMRDLRHFYRGSLELSSQLRGERP